MAGVKRKTNNPNGRPPKSRALTELLDRALSRSVPMPDGKSVSGKRVLANLVTDVLTTGRLRFHADTEDSVISVKDWLEFVKWFYNYAEPPTQRQEVTGAEGGAIKFDIESWKRDRAKRVQDAESEGE